MVLLVVVGRLVSSRFGEMVCTVLFFLVHFYFGSKGGLLVWSQLRNVHSLSLTRRQQGDARSVCADAMSIDVRCNCGYIGLFMKLSCRAEPAQKICICREAATTVSGGEPV